MPTKKEVTPFVFLSEQTDVNNPQKDILLKKPVKTHTIVFDDSKRNETIPFFPTSFVAIEEIAYELTKGASIVLNVSSLTENEAMRILDFLSGIIYVYKGKIKQIGDYDFELSIFNE
jgi:FtsZ-interacting cell division protein YlmF